MIAIGFKARFRAFASTSIILGLTTCGSAPQPDVNGIEISSLKKELVDLRSDLWNRTYDPHTTAWLTPTEKTFAFLNTELGPLTLAVDEITAKGDGSELTLRIGNPTSATITTLKFHAQWGPVDKTDLFVDGESREGDKEVTAALLPGAWNVVTLSFAGIPPAKMGRIEISKPQISNITMRGL